jgi:general secretion pathway protein G
MSKGERRCKIPLRDFIRSFRSIRGFLKKHGQSGEEGFTLIEIMVASMILLIIISVSGFMVTRNIGKARTVSAKNQIQIFSMALNSYFLDCGIYPSKDQGLNALWEKPINEPIPVEWDGPYLDKKIPNDPWGNPYVYESPGPNGLPFGIRSFGADGADGGNEKSKDIVSWEG